MAHRWFHLLLLIMLASSYLISSYAIPMSRISSLLHGKGGIMGSEITIQNEMSSDVEDNMTEDSFIEGRMDIEKNDYGPTTSNPVHTPKPPRV